MSEFQAYIAEGHEDTEVQYYTPGAGTNEPSVVGDLWFYETTDNTADRCGADPALIGGICEVDTAKAKDLTPDGKVPFRQIKGPRATLALSSATTPAQSHVGDQFGVTRSAGGKWQLDTAKTGATARMLVKKVDITNGIFFCQLLNTEAQFGTVA